MAKEIEKPPPVPVVIPRPYGNRLIVDKIKPPKTTASGLHLPEGLRNEPVEKGTVLCKGDGRMLDDGTLMRMEIGVGDTVYFPAYAGREIELSDGRKLYVVQEQDIFAIVPE